MSGAVTAPDITTVTVNCFEDTSELSSRIYICKISVGIDQVTASGSSSARSRQSNHLLHRNVQLAAFS